MVTGPSTIAAHFTEMARTLGVTESDFLVMGIAGINTHSSFFFRVPTADSLETFIAEEIFPYRAYEDDEGDEVKVEWYMRRNLPDNRTVNQFMRDRESQCLRQLWEVSKSLAKKDILTLTEDKVEGAAPRRLSLPMARDLEEKSKLMGFDVLGDYERPGQLALSKVNSNHAPGVIPAYLQWEEFTSVVEENKATRKGVKTKDVSYQVVPDDNGFKYVKKGSELKRESVVEPLALTEVLRVRSVAYAILEIVEVLPGGAMTNYDRLTSLYLRALRDKVPVRMRRPTMGEVRLFDREVHVKIYENMARDSSATLGEGLRWWLDHQEHRLWKFLEPQIENYPDQSVESAWEGPGGKGARLALTDGTDQAAGDSLPDLPAQVLSRKCYQCKKPLRDHANYKFCPRKTKGKGDKGGGKNKNKGNSIVPKHMKGMAGRTMPSAKHPTGKAICWEYHGQGCKFGAKCNKSHVCPRFLDGGAICEGNHTLDNCPHK